MKTGSCVTRLKVRNERRDINRKTEKSLRLKYMNRHKKKHEQAQEKTRTGAKKQEHAQEKTRTGASKDKNMRKNKNKNGHCARLGCDVRNKL